MKKAHSAALVTAASELLAHIEPAHPRQPVPEATTAAASLARLIHSENYGGNDTLALIESASKASSRVVDKQAATAASFQAVLAEISKQGHTAQFVGRDKL
jgi:hypothetical protein